MTRLLALFLAALSVFGQGIAIRHRLAIPWSVPYASAGYVADDGATIPQYASVREAGIYVASQDTTYFTWEAWDTDHRETHASSYNHTTGAFSVITDVGTTNLVNDDHGAPAMVADGDGYIHLFCCSHYAGDSNGGDTQYAVTDSPYDVTAWTVGSELAGDFGYQHPVYYDGVIYLFRREGPNNGYDLTLTKTTALTSGSATWGTPADIIDFGPNRVYAGNFSVVGDEIWFIACIGDAAATMRWNIYFFRYETDTGDVTNWAGTATIDSLDLPVDQTEADADFLLVDQNGAGTETTDIPVWLIDGSSHAHIFYGDGPHDGSFAIKYFYDTGSGWSDTETLAYVQNRLDTFAPILRSNGDIDLYFSYPHPFTWGTLGIPIDGGPVLVTRYADGTLSRHRRVMDAGSSAIGRFIPVENGSANARVMFAEQADGREDVYAGGKRIYLYGDSGFLNRP